MTNDNGDTRQERREKKLRKKKEKIPQHGRSLWQIYRDAIEKRRREKEGGVIKASRRYTR